MFSSSPCINRNEESSVFQTYQNIIDQALHPSLLKRGPDLDFTGRPRLQPTEADIKASGRQDDSLGEGVEESDYVVVGSGIGGEHLL